jgi:GTPase-associated protein 1, N-terminal domain type 2
MPTPSSKSPERTPVIEGPIEQLYVMHCLKEDSVLGQEGFSVRAASPGANDPAIFEWALRLDYYELPLDMKTGALLMNQAPRRLARVPGPPGRVALIHTAYLPQDTVGRSHSFLSQIALLPELPNLAAAAAWGSTEWQTTEYARGDTKVLPPLDRLPRGTLIDQAALKGFLSTGTAPQDQSLARTIYPSRVESNPEARRRWVRAALQGFLRAGEPSARKARLCILAEPGAVALLVYAIARLLPEQIAGAFPFSTYEPHYTSLRDNKVARVIGSYARNGLDRADLESLRRRGYVLDTLRNEEDPDLAVAADWPLEGIITLAAEGNWQSVDEIRELWSRDPRVAPGVSAAVLGEALRVRPLAAALKSGTLAAEGLLELRRNRFGEGLLREDEFRRPTWEAVRKVWSQPAIRHEFADLLRDHVEELLADVTGLVETGPPGAWREAWEALKPVIPAERRLDSFSKLLAAMEHTGAALPAGERAILLVDWAQAAPPNAAFPAGLHWLLHAGSAEAFRTLLPSSKVSTRLAGVATCLALCGGADWSADPAFLADLPEDQFHAFATALPGFESRKSVYDRLRSTRGSSKALVDRLLRLRSRLPESCVEDVLSALACDESAWHDYWLKGGGTNFAALLGRLPSDSGLARRIWNGLLGRVTAENFADDEASEIESLAGIAGRYPGSLLREQQERLESWKAIKEEFAGPATKSPPAVRSANLASACRTVNVKREDLAERWFRTHILTASSPAELKEHSEQFGNALVGFFETEDAACAQALELANGPEKRELRRRCTSAMFKAIVSAENHDRLARKFESLLRETDIRPAPEVDLLQRGKRGGRTGKGLGIGRYRVSPQATRYAGVFLGGAASALLLMLLLFPLVTNVMTSLASWWQPNGAAQAVDAEKKAQQDLRAERNRNEQLLAELQDKDKKIEDLEAVLGEMRSAAAADAAPATKNRPKTIRTADTKTANEGKDTKGKSLPLETPISNLTKQDKPTESSGEATPDGRNADSSPRSTTANGRPPAQGATETPVEKTTEPRQTGAADIRAKLDKLILDVPLGEEGIPAAKELVERLGGDQAGSHLGRSDQLIRQIVLGLSVHDVPTDIGDRTRKTGQKATEPPSKTNFAFIAGGAKDQAALAALTLKPTKPKRNALSVYFFDLAEQRFWTNQLRSSGDTNYVLGSSPTGEYFLLGRINRGPIGSDYYCLIDSARFYAENLDHQKEKSLSLPEKKLPISAELHMSPTFSDHGDWCAFAESESGDSESLPRVKVMSVLIDSKKDLDFSPCAAVLKPDWNLAGMSFDRDARSLVVGFVAKPFLLAFPLSDDAPAGEAKPIRPKVISLKTGPPRGWAHRSDGKYIGIVSEGSIYIEDITAPEPDKTKTAVSADSLKHATCVTFGPKGTVLATGDIDGVITIRSLSIATDTGGQVQTKVIMRLQHVGQIQKLAFSPDGRVLAALALPPDAPRDGGEADGWSWSKNWDRPGIIRLWVTQAWERDEQPKVENGAAVAPGAK